jgi:hypothetical protein
MFGNRRHFRELVAGSEEGIATNILASRLKQLVAAYRPGYRWRRTSDDFRFEGFGPEEELIWVPLTPQSEAN